LFISAWSGTLTTSGVFDAQNGFSATFTSALQPGSVTPAGTGELLVTNIVTQGNDTESIDSSFKIQDSQYGYSDFAAWAYLVDLNSSTVNPTWTPSGGGTPGAAVIAAFKPASGGGGGTAPSITSANSTTFTVGTAGSFTVTTTGTPTPSLTEAGALPSGVTFANKGNGTATLSGTPAAGTAGSYPITITASNGVGTNASQAFTLTVGGGGAGGGSNFAYVAGSVTGVNNFGTTSGTTLSVTLHQNPRAGDLLLCGANWQASATASMSDPNNGTWKAVGTATAGTGGESGMTAQMFYVPSAVSASTTVTLTISSPAAFRGFECAEYSYTGTISFDGTPQYSTTPASGGVATISGLTTSNSNDLVFAACLAVDTSCTAASGYTPLDDPNTYDVTSGTFGHSYVGLNGQMVQYKVGVAAGTQSATFGTGTATDSVILGLVAF
jgi:hypothetical protein